MKTIEEWFKQLPEPYQQQALNNVLSKKLDKQTQSLAFAIDIGMCWQLTPEGHNYWKDICDRAGKGEFDHKPIPKTLL